MPLSSTDGARDDLTKREARERDHLQEGHHFIPVNSFTSRLTDLGNQHIVIKEKGRRRRESVKRLELTDTHHFLSSC